MDDGRHNDGQLFLPLVAAVEDDQHDGGELLLLLVAAVEGGQRDVVWDVAPLRRASDTMAGS